MKEYALKEQYIGKDVVIDPSVQFINVEKLYLGDHTYLGPGVRIIGGSFATGDYSKIHNNCYIYSKNSIVLGHNTWIGQGTHLDGTGGIRSGNFLGVGINSALYSHIRHGDVLEGCRFDGNSFLEIGHDVWFVGMCMVSPIIAHHKSMALLGSVVTRNMEENSVYGGNPANILNDKIGRPWLPISLDEKRNGMLKHIEDYSKANPQWPKESVKVVDAFSSNPQGATEYNMATRTYMKTGSDPEVSFNKWLFPYKAKFAPEISNLPYKFSLQPSRLGLVK